MVTAVSRHPLCLLDHLHRCFFTTVIVELAEPLAIFRYRTVAVAENRIFPIHLVFPDGDVIVNLVDNFCDQPVCVDVEDVRNVLRFGEGEA